MNRVRLCGAGPNFSDNYFIFDPRTGLFVYNEDFSNLTQPEIDPTKKEVRSAWRNGAMEHGTARYRWVGGHLVLVEKAVETCGVEPDDPGVCMVVTERLVKGKYVETTTKTRESM